MPVPCQNGRTGTLKDARLQDCPVSEDSEHFREATATAAIASETITLRLKLLRIGEEFELVRNNCQ